MIDTHAHLNFSRFKKNVPEVLAAGHEAGVKIVIVPGTDVESSMRAVELANEYPSIFAAIGIHPHHAFELDGSDYQNAVARISSLAQNKRVVAIGEIGLDCHQYIDTKYKTYHIDDHFVEAQKKLFTSQLAIALTYKKSVIIHNREAKQHLLPLLNEHWDDRFRHKMVFHCCEPDGEMLAFAQQHEIYIGVDGDVTYWSEKQEFIKQVPIDMLVLETDSPFLLPEPLKSQKLYPNTPANLPLIVECIAKIKNLDTDVVIQVSTENARSLFGLHTKT